VTALAPTTSTGDGTTPGTSRRPPWRLAVLLGIAGTIISSLGSWIPSLWGDEAASVLSAERPLGSLFVMLTHVDAVHGTYYVFLHFWVDVFGASPFSVRMPPAIAVGFVVAGVVLLVDTLGTTRLAIVAGIICCVLPRDTYMGEETRTYAFSAAYAVWTAWILVRLLRDRGESRRWWVAYGVVMACGTYAFLYFGLFFVVHALVLTTMRPPRTFVRRWVTTSLIAIASTLPLIVVGYLQRDQVAYLADQTTITVNSMTVGLWFWTDWFAVAAWILILVGLGATLWRWRRSRGPVPLLALLALCWMVVPGVILVIASIPQNSFTSRYLSFSAPAAAILMALGIQALARGGAKRMIGLALLTAVATAPIYLSQRTPYAKNGSDWAQISSTIGSHAHRGDAIVFDDGARPSRRPRLALHTYPAGFVGLKDVTLETPFQKSTTWYDRTYTVPQAEKLGRFTTVSTVWLVEYRPSGKADTYGLSAIKSMGFAVTSTYTTHSSLIIELVRG